MSCPKLACLPGRFSLGCFVQSLAPLITWGFVGSGHQKGQNVVSEAHFGNLEAKATKTFKLRLEAHFGPVQAQDIKMVEKQLVNGSASGP